MLDDFRFFHIFRNKLGLLNKDKNDELLINSLLWVSVSKSKIGLFQSNIRLKLDSSFKRRILHVQNQ